MTASDRDWLQEPIPPLDTDSITAAQARQRELTKPPGSLGRLEELGVVLAAMQRTQRPSVERVTILIFAADHGVATEGISAFPQAVTAQMVHNFAHGGAAISVLARLWQAHLQVINVGTLEPLEPLPNVLDRRIGPGTANFLQQPALQPDQLTRALVIGREAVDNATEAGTQLLIGGEMGIGNSTAAAALGCALLNDSARTLAGPGTGLDKAGVEHKINVIEAALALHSTRQPLEALQRLGGFEIVALVGAYLRSGQRGIPVLVDGFIATAAALAAVRLRPELAAWLLYSHRSSEPGHQRLLQALQAQPLLDLQLRLGEGSGAAVALPLLRAAAALHSEMATFAEAQVSAQ
ncbi:MAG: nicotinate-nucleotide--dimethylbenzimidazole phosphoribosyltransferase [Candidatus Competibacteraceae bacterium]|jgi:nicotinate-nucleotide--dimethylbenzimidazole phosphoribosyltransferase|nr:nicotinate-nucleotide--dimethylbenzimidazole phosphoribosyltransferase [Candidatus Competibacteraceae bacterium]